jgi:hypothetical protein
MKLLILFSNRIDPEKINSIHDEYKFEYEQNFKYHLMPSILVSNLGICGTIADKISDKFGANRGHRDSESLKWNFNVTLDEMSKRIINNSSEIVLACVHYDFNEIINLLEKIRHDSPIDLFMSKHYKGLLIYKGLDPSKQVIIFDKKKKDITVHDGVLLPVAKEE